MPSPITRMNPAALPDASKAGYSQISVVDSARLAFVSGQVAWTVEDSTTPETIGAQTTIVIANLQASLDALGACPHDIVQMRIYAVNLTPETQDIAMGQIGAFLNGAQPSLTGIGVSALAGPDLKIEIEMVVQVPA